MSIRQKEDIKSYIKRDDSQNMLLKKLRNERHNNYSNNIIINRPFQKVDNSIDSKTIYNTSKRHFPSITILSSNKTLSNNNNNKSYNKYNSIKTISTSSLEKIKTNLKNIGSSKDFKNNRNNNYLFISKYQNTSHPNHKNILKAQKSDKNYNNASKKEIIEINSNRKSTTILYKRRNETEKKIFPTYNTSNNTFISKFKKNSNFIKSYNYNINSKTYKNSKENNINKYRSMNISDINNNNNDFNSGTKDYNYKGRETTYMYKRNKESRFRTKDDCNMFNTKNIISFDNSNLINRNIDKNYSKDKKYGILSINNYSSMGKKFFFNPYKNNNKNNFINNSSYTNNINKSKEINNDFDFRKDHIMRRNNDINNEIKITKVSKKDNKNNYSNSYYINKGQNIFNNKTERKLLDINKKYLIKTENNNSRNK